MTAASVRTMLRRVFGYLIGGPVVVAFDFSLIKPVLAATSIVVKVKIRDAKTPEAVANSVPNRHTSVVNARWWGRWDLNPRHPPSLSSTGIFTRS